MGRLGSSIASKVLLSALCVGLILALQSAGGVGQASPRSNRDVATFAPANTSELLSKPNAIAVKVGAYVDNFHDLSLQNRRFVAEGYYWLEWPQSLQNKLDSEKIEPKSIIVLANQVDNWDGQINSFSEEPIRLANGNYYQQFQFSANFYIPEINLRRFPFESVELPVIFEIGDDSLAIQKGNVILVPDASRNALVGSFAEINGYRITSSVLKPTVHTFGTNLGLNNGDLSYSGVALQATLKSTPLPSILKYFLPLMIVVGIVILAPSLEGELGDIRLAIPSTGLLTLIFLQQAYEADLPELDYLTFLDWIYACGYVIAIGTFLLFVWGTNYYQRTPKKGKEQALATINRADIIFQASAVVGTVVAGLMAWMA
uniref:hypothetical protein n=1 Tax=Cyanobium sp. TaxID=2164130 RepID=UPI00404A5762